MNILSILGDANMVAPVSTVAENITPTTADLNMWELSSQRRDYNDSSTYSFNTSYLHLHRAYYCNT